MNQTRLPRRRKKIPLLCGPDIGRYRGRGRGRSKSKPRFGDQYYVAFRGPDGKPAYQLFGNHHESAKREYELWKLANYEGIRVSGGTADDHLGPHPPPVPSATATFPTVLSSFLASEKNRVREEDSGRRTDRTEGTISIKEYWGLRARLLILADWAKTHFGPERFRTVPLSELFLIQDYTAMMAHFTTRAKPKSHGIKSSGYSSMYCKKLRLSFWQMAGIDGVTRTVSAQYPHQFIGVYCPDLRTQDLLCRLPLGVQGIWTTSNGLWPPDAAARAAIQRARQESGWDGLHFVEINPTQFTPIASSIESQSRSVHRAPTLEVDVAVFTGPLPGGQLDPGTLFM